MDTENCMGLIRTGCTVHCKKCGVTERPRPKEQYFHVSMVTHTVTMETGKYCSPGAFQYTTFFTVCKLQSRPFYTSLRD